MTRDPDCVFCSIVAGDLPAEVVLDEPDVVAFLDRRPLFKGHLLLVPREHAEDDAGDEEGDHGAAG